MPSPVEGSPHLKPQGSSAPSPEQRLSAAQDVVAVPEQAHLASSPAQPASPSSANTNADRPALPTRSPSYLASFARTSLPSSSISEDHAKFPDILTPRADGNAFVGPVLGTRRSRSASTSSLGSVIRRQTSSGSIRSPVRQGSSSSSLLNKPLPPIHDSDGGSAELEHESHKSDAALGQLSWNSKWWPFSVVPPDKGKGKVAQDVADDDGAGLSTSPSKTGGVNWMSLFAGKLVAEQTQAHIEEQHRKDEREQALLDADLDTFTKNATASALQSSETPTKYRDADEGSPHPGTKRPSSLRSDELTHKRQASSTSQKSTSFLPTSMFSSSSGSSKGTLDGPLSMFSSLSLTNPFTSSASTTQSQRPRVHRHYSTSKSDEDGPTAKRKEVERYLDDEDTKTAKKEDDSHMEVFSMIKERYRCPNYPLVFCHGLFGFDVLGPANIKPLQFSYWVGVREALEALGAEVLIGRVPASASIEERAKVLCELIEATYPNREVNLIGHSMGGLDARFLVSRLRPTTFKVRSVTTISTPHRGSSFADYLLEDVLGPKNVPSLLNLMETVGVPGGGKAFDDLTVTKMARFNDETPDHPDVKYFSYGAEFEPSWSNVFRVPWGIIKEREGDNDGLVSVKSAQWGEYKATLNNVSHLDLIGWVGKVRFGWASLLGQPIKFKPISFFCAVAEDLADNDL
ncbi:lipase 2 [Microbotryomycetes sp. JL201]|nr:lipase 2 [Microbotryomycetes sp. JL201]